MNKTFTAFYLFSFLLFFSSRIEAQFNSTYGGPFSPRGDIRFLVIYAGFEAECDNSSEGVWPNVNRSEKHCQTYPVYHNILFYNSYDQFNPQANDKSISNFYYQMSRHHPVHPPLRIVADVFPERINISGSNPDAYKVFKIIQDKYPNFDWSRYDQRKNPSEFTFDNSKTTSDHVLDYVIVVFRKYGASGFASITPFQFSTKAKGAEEIYKVDGISGFTVTKGMTDHITGFAALFHHEFAHTLFNCPHLFGVNGVCGDYFYNTIGWGMMNYGTANCSANAWESWYNGWIELPVNRDLNNFTHNGKYVLKDFVTRGDAMRIKLPFCNQFLWLENHAGISELDDRGIFTRDGMSDSIPASEMGLFMYIENVSDSRSKLIQALSPDYANGIKVMHGKGNYDYKTLSFGKDQRWWKNMVADFTVVGPNPAGPCNDITRVRDNYGFDTIFPDKIYYCKFTNNPHSGCLMCSNENSNVALTQESLEIIKKNGVFTFDGIGLHMAFGNGELPEKIGISSNPMITNHQKYICPDKMEPVYLHGLSINILSKSDNGDVTVEIRFDDTEISSDQRFTGELLLNGVANAEYDLRVNNGCQLTIDKSASPNRDNKGTVIDGEYEFPDFINPSILTLETGTRVFVEKGAKLIVKNQSTLRIRSGATLIVKGKLVIEKGCYLDVESGGNIHLNGGSLKKHKKSHSGLNPKLK